MSYLIIQREHSKIHPIKLLLAKTRKVGNLFQINFQIKIEKSYNLNEIYEIQLNCVGKSLLSIDNYFECEKYGMFFQKPYGFCKKLEYRIHVDTYYILRKFCSLQRNMTPWILIYHRFLFFF